MCFLVRLDCSITPTLSQGNQVFNEKNTHSLLEITYLGRLTTLGHIAQDTLYEWQMSEKEATDDSTSDDEENRPEVHASWTNWA
mgnify:FL=1